MEEEEEGKCAGLLVLDASLTGRFPLARLNDRVAPEDLTAVDLDSGWRGCVCLSMFVRQLLVFTLGSVRAA